MEITRPRTCNENCTPRDLYCTPWECYGEGAYQNLLFYCRGVLTVLKSIHPRRGKKNGDSDDKSDSDAMMVMIMVVMMMMVVMVHMMRV